MYIITAQNLVQNPSFEEFYKCPNINIKGNNITDLKYWKSNYNGDVAVFNTCSNTVPITYIGGYQQSKTGNGYIAIGVRYYYMEDWLQSNRRGYAIGNFMTPLIKDSVYCVSYYVSRCDETKGAIQNVDALISADTLFNFYNNVTEYYIESKPQIKSTQMLTDTAGWTLVSDLYKAKGGERYITIGNFMSPANTIEIPYYIPEQTAVSYFLDDVSVTPTYLNASALGKDTLLCYNSPYTLHAPTGYDAYLWSNGSNATTLPITTAGTYWLKCSLTGCGSVYDTVTITLRPKPLPLQLGANTTLCQGKSLSLTAQAGYATYAWSTSATTPSIIVTDSGWYKVTATEYCSVQKDSVHIALDALPNLHINLGNDTTVCQALTNTNLPITLTPNLALPNYNWNTGHTTPTITINQSGWYILTTHYNCGYLSDTVRVNQCVDQPPYGLYIPNAFTPNKDKLNEAFTVVQYNINIEDFKIYTRRGNLVYDDTAASWNGTYKDNECPTGEYIYKLLYYNTITQTHAQRVGLVALLRD